MRFVGLTGSEDAPATDRRGKVTHRKQTRLRVAGPRRQWSRIRLELETAKRETKERRMGKPNVVKW